MLSRIPKTLKIVLGLVFFPILIAILAKTLRVRILSVAGTGFYTYVLYHVFTKDMMQTGNSVEFAYQKMVWLTWGWGFVAVICVGLALEAVFGKEKSVGSTEFGSRGKHLRGRIYKSVAKFGYKKDGNFNFANHLINKDILKLHTLIAGSTGSGKSQLLLSILKQLKNNEKVVISDPGGEFTSKFYESRKDIILNPFDRRSASWNPFLEITDLSDIPTLSLSFLPKKNGEEETWNTYARNFLTDIISCMFIDKNFSVKELIFHIIFKDMQQTFDMLNKNNKASTAYFGKGWEKTLASIQFVASQIVPTLEILEDKGNFSVKKWMKEGSGKLFVPYQARHRAILNRLLPLWVSNSIDEIITMEPDRKRQIFLIIDELDSLEKISSLQTGLQEGRKFGLSCVLCLQSVNQLIAKYGQNFGAILNCVNNFAILKQSGGANAGGNIADSRFWSEFIGNEEIERKEISTSKRGLDISGKSEHDRVESIRLVKEEELTALKARTGFVVFADDLELAIGAGIVRDFSLEIQELTDIAKKNEQKEIKILEPTTTITKMTEETTQVTQTTEQEEQEEDSVGEHLEDPTEEIKGTKTEEETNTNYEDYFSDSEGET